MDDLNEKLKQLAKECDENGEYFTASMLLTIVGAREFGDEKKLAKNVYDFMVSDLIPRANKLDDLGFDINSLN